MKKYGQNQKDSTKKRKKFQFTKATHKRIRQMAKKMKISKNAYLIACIEEGIEMFAKTNIFLSALNDDKNRI